MYLLSFCVPESHLESVKSALFQQGAGRFNHYDCCAWQTQGTGQFRALDGSKPFIGKQDHIEQVEEYKVEMICQDSCLDAVIKALKSAHPYEEPAFQYWRINN